MATNYQKLLKISIGSAAAATEHNGVEHATKNESPEQSTTVFIQTIESTKSLTQSSEISQTKIFKLDEDDHGTRIITLAEINVGDSMPGEMDEKAGIQRNMWL
ncbi:hypothetical protein FXO38_20751 [Capsicum annuum]|nr:hypothetical protein FXO37_33187 [Capsicum annuum]KAF3643192.1 hypothetical protein FXO38_20751 [Capsicum annuum]